MLTHRFLMYYPSVHTLNESKCKCQGKGKGKCKGKYKGKCKCKGKDNGKVGSVLNYALSHEDVLWSGGIAPRILNLSTRWK
jgi:hypothetical protein